MWRWRESKLTASVQVSHFLPSSALLRSFENMGEPFRFPHARCAGTLLISTNKRRPDGRFFICGDGGNRTRVQLRLVERFYGDSRNCSLMNVLEMSTKHTFTISVRQLADSKHDVRSAMFLHPGYDIRIRVWIPPNERALLKRVRMQNPWLRSTEKRCF